MVHPMGVTGLEFFLCGDKRSVVELALGALAPGSEALFFTVDFFFLKMFPTVGRPESRLPSSAQFQA